MLILLGVDVMIDLLKNVLARILKYFHFIPDKFYLRILYWLKMGKKLHLNSPQTFNEKIQWLKLYDRNPEYTKMVDKLEVKKYVATIIGEEYVIPTLAVWEKIEEIDLNQLPNQFVLKCTHDSGGLVICKDRSKFDSRKAFKKIGDSLNKNYYWGGREWPYKNVRPRIIAEMYVEDVEDHELRDYKFYCFNGEPYRLLLATGRQNKIRGLCFDYFDMEFNHLLLTNHWHPNAPEIPHMPSHFEEMKTMARKLSKGIPQVRVDFYEANGQVYFGELTFCDMGGFLKIHPDYWELEWGGKIMLPQITVL